MIMATVDGVITSRVMFSRAAPVADLPWPLAIAASIEALGKPARVCKFQVDSGREGKYPIMYLSSQSAI